MLSELNDKLQELYSVLTEVNELIPDTTCEDPDWEDLFAECVNLRQAFENIGAEDGSVPEFSESCLGGEYEH